jgi:hypothetical protein
MAIHFELGKLGVFFAIPLADGIIAFIYIWFSPLPFCHGSK